MAQATRGTRRVTLTEMINEAQAMLMLQASRLSDVDKAICLPWVSWVFVGGDQPSKELPKDTVVHVEFRRVVTCVITDAYGMSAPDVLGRDFFVRRNRVTSLATVR